MKAMMRARDFKRLIPVLFALGACGQSPPDADIRDARPRQIHRGDKLTVEASRPLFTVGAPTIVQLNAPTKVDLHFAARAVSPTRVLVDADAKMEKQLEHLVDIAATVEVVQEVSGERRVFDSAPGAPFEFQFFPTSLQSAAAHVADKSSSIPNWLFAALSMLIAAALVALPIPVIGGLIVVWERKISGYMQARIGPNRVGPNGWLQWLADGLKLILKEDVIPTDADSRLFRVAPYFAFIGLFLTFMVIPFSGWVVVADLDVGVLFLLSVTSLVVVGIIMGGWSSNSKWSLLGGMRSAAQIISYELPASVALLGIAIMTGSLSTQAIVRAQGGWPWQWFMFQNPFLFACFFIYYISALAEGNRTPFDLPEAESELVSGFATEYSGFRYALYPLVEWVNVFIIGAIAAMLFWGGWQVPGVAVWEMDSSGWLQLAGFTLYLIKIVALVFVTIWIRWTLPRMRVDQMMNLCWKYLIPLSFACFLGTLLWAWLLPAAVQKWSAPVFFLVGGVLPLAYFVKRVQYNRSRFTHFTTNAIFLQKGAE